MENNADYFDYSEMSREDLIETINQLNEAVLILKNNCSAQMVFLSINKKLNSYLAYRNMYANELDELRKRQYVSECRDKIMTVMLIHKEKYKIEDFIPNPN